MARLQRKVAMCLMAHPDDCELLAAGTMALLQQRGWEIHIVTMTPGDCGTTGMTPAEIARIRRGEGARGAKILGGTYHCLESRDLFIMFDEPTLRQTLMLTREIAPSLMITHSLVDYMVDHEQTARIARSASFAYSTPNVCPGPIVKGSGIPYLYYADPIEGVDVYGDRIVPRTYVNIAETISVKTRALKAHASQREWLMKHHGMDQYLESMKQWGKLRGKEVGVPCAEGFRQHMGHPYPHDCILQKELGDLVMPVSREGD